MLQFLSHLLAPLSLIAHLILSGAESDAVSSGDTGSILDPNG